MLDARQELACLRQREPPLDESLLVGADHIVSSASRGTGRTSSRHRESWILVLAPSFASSLVGNGENGGPISPIVGSVALTTRCGAQLVFISQQCLDMREH